MNPVDILVWTFVAVFVLTAAITLLGIIDNVKFVQVSDKYLKGLYAALLLEIVAAGVSIATGKLDPIIERPKVDKVIDLEPRELLNSAGCLIVTCHNDKPAMLMVMHEEKERIVFSPPAGKSKQNESPIETAIRETKEETGYSVIGKKVIGNSPKGNTKFRLVLAELDTTKMANPHFQEVTGVIWINPAKIPTASWRFPEQKEWIIEAFEEYAPNNCNSH